LLINYGKIFNGLLDGLSRYTIPPKVKLVIKRTKPGKLDISYHGIGHHLLETTQIDKNASGR
jgi:hypothetical protein